MENAQNKVIKNISRIANCHGSVLEWRIFPVEQPKSSTDCEIFAIVHAVEI